MDVGYSEAFRGVPTCITGFKVFIWCFKGLMSVSEGFRKLVVTPMKPVQTLGPSLEHHETPLELLNHPFNASENPGTPLKHPGNQLVPP